MNEAAVHRMLLDALTQVEQAKDVHGVREAETRAANWAAILTALMVHAEYLDVRAQRLERTKEELADALRQAVADRKKANG